MDGMYWSAHFIQSKIPSRRLKLDDNADVLDFILNMSNIWLLREGGLALSTAMSAIVQIIILTIILQKRLRTKIGSEVVVSMLKTVIASILMALVLLDHPLRMFPASRGDWQS